MINVTEGCVGDEGDVNGYGHNIVLISRVRFDGEFYNR